MAPLVTEGKKRLFFPKLFFPDNAFWLFQDDFACWPPYFHASTFKEWWLVYPKQWFPRRHAQPRQSNSQHAGALFTTSCCNPLAVHVCAGNLFE